MTKVDRTAAIRWLQTARVGTSSETIYRTLMGESLQRADIPYDPDDFSRCYELLRRVPSFRRRLPEVATAYPKWKPFVEAWDELTKLYEQGCETDWQPPHVMHERMRELRGEARRDE
jgi:hypothetical protein